MRAVITVTGKDNMGIIAKVSGECFAHNVNILDISQSVLDDFFAMSMLADISAVSGEYEVFTEKMTALGEKNNLRIYVMREDIFDSMHRI